MKDVGLNDIIDLRKNEKVFKEITCKKLLPYVVGKRKWDAEVHVQLVSDFSTPSDEAWMLLVLENCWECWEYESQDSHPEDSTKPVKKYTRDKRERGRNRGWTQAGIARFNELCQIAGEDRAKNKKVEEEYLAEKIDEQEEKMGSRKRKRNTDDDEVEWLEPYNDGLVDEWAKYI